MRIAALIRSRPHTRYFVNRIHRAHGVSLVVVESPRSTKTFSAVLKKNGLGGLARTLARRYPSKERVEHFTAAFGDDWKQIDSRIPVLVSENINSPEVHERLRELSPDLLLDHGTSIVRGHILETAGLALNLHWGLSPYYRGVACTEWALLNWDPYNVGVTIHVLSPQIDGGRIVAQERVEIRPRDRVEEINHRITVAGTGLVDQIISRLGRGEPLDSTPQQSADGQLFLKMHFSKHLRKQVGYIENNGLIETMLARPSRKEKLPIVSLH